MTPSFVWLLGVVGIKAYEGSGTDRVGWDLLQGTLLGLRGSSAGHRRMMGTFRFLEGVVFPSLDFLVYPDLRDRWMKVQRGLRYREVVRSMRKSVGDTFDLGGGGCTCSEVWGSA